MSIRGSGSLLTEMEIRIRVASSILFNHPFPCFCHYQVFVCSFASLALLRRAPPSNSRAGVLSSFSSRRSYFNCGCILWAFGLLITRPDSPPALLLARRAGPVERSLIATPPPTLWYGLMRYKVSMAACFGLSPASSSYHPLTLLPLTFPLAAPSPGATASPVRSFVQEVASRGPDHQYGGGTPGGRHDFSGRDAVDAAVRCVCLLIETSWKR